MRNDDLYYESVYIKNNLKYLSGPYKNMSAMCIDYSHQAVKVNSCSHPQLMR